MVNALAIAREDADAVPLGEVADKVRASCAGVLGGDRGQIVTEVLVVQQRKGRNLVGLSSDATSWGGSATDTPKSKLKSLYSWTPS